MALWLDKTNPLKQVVVGLTFDTRELLWHTPRFGCFHLKQPYSVIDCIRLGGGNVGDVVQEILDFQLV